MKVKQLVLNILPFSEREQLSGRAGCSWGEGVSWGPGERVAGRQGAGIEIQGRRDGLDALRPTLLPVLLRVGRPGLRGPGRRTDRGGPRGRGGDVIVFFLH